MNMKNENIVTIRGEIASKLVTPRAAFISVKPATLEFNLPNFIFVGSIIERIRTDYNAGDLVEIKGYLQTGKKSKEPKNAELKRVYGESITPISLSELEPSSDNNVFQVCGTLRGVKKICENVVRFNVMTMKNDKVMFVKIEQYTSEPDKVVESFRPGEFVTVIGNVQTSRKVKRGQPVYYENYIARKVFGVGIEAADDGQIALAS